MADDPKNQKSEGIKDKAKGRAKEAAGALTDDKEQKSKGKKDQAKGEAKKKVADTREKVRDKT